MRSGEADSAGKVGEAIVHGVGEGVGEALGEAAIQGIEKAIGQGTGEKASLGIREARDPHLGDALAHKLKEASHALKNTGSEAGRQAENIIGHGVDPAHSSWQGAPGSNGAWGTNGQPPSGHHGIPGSQGSSGGPGDTHDHVFSGGSGGSFGANAQGGSWGQGGHRGPFNPGANSQGTAPQPGSVRSSSNGNTEGYNPNSSSGSRVGSGGRNKPEGQGSGGEGEAVSGINTLNSQTSSEPFNFDTFWKNFKSKLGFINWDALNKDFKHNTPFLNWKVITENYNYNQQGPPTALGGQYPVKTPAKEETTIGNYAAGPEAFNAQFLNIDKLRSAFKNDEFLNWHALFESIKRKLPFLNWDAFPKLKGLRSATPDAQ
ncbi:hypothetical protein MJG53_013702 [Ovis ammon polii x Ovis aries]|uniref:Uncharacterized protein n=1 Tax=Ovis ammon polii x Ovis aries TaxID=2918886 RepID=A0ACB9UJA4_9CETA|nr:hypothetical protein MJT46_013318 [Ovis ammon polii x Ovis aries]KAI4571596.1 hypothetical protein MJG53_013702 [Ovis ammon polii x Ovis aries]